MPINSELLVQNALLATLSKSDLALICAKFEWADLALGDVLYTAHKPVENAYFPISGIYSVIAQNEEKVQIETGLIGREGFVGIPIVLFATSAPSQVILHCKKCFYNLPIPFQFRFLKPR
jgi:hypothetical protein